MDIVERLRFDAARCEAQFSKGVAGNIEEAAAEIERLRAARIDPTTKEEREVGAHGCGLALMRLRTQSNALTSPAPAAV